MMVVTVVKIILILWAIGYLIVGCIMFPFFGEYAIHGADTKRRKAVTIGKALVFWMCWPIILLIRFSQKT